MTTPARPQSAPDANPAPDQRPADSSAALLSPEAVAAIRGRHGPWKGRVYCRCGAVWLPSDPCDAVVLADAYDHLAATLAMLKADPERGGRVEAK